MTKFFPLNLLTVVAGSLLATLPIAAKPVHFPTEMVTRGGSSFDLYVEPNSIERDDSRVTWVQEAIHRDGRGSLVYHARALMLADCGNRDRQVRRELTVLVEDGQTVQPYLSAGRSSPVEEIRPGTAAEKALAFVCKAG